jgi:hypothetical protein
VNLHVPVKRRRCGRDECKRTTDYVIEFIQTTPKPGSVSTLKHGSVSSWGEITWADSAALLRATLWRNTRPELIAHGQAVGRAPSVAPPSSLARARPRVSGTPARAFHPICAEDSAMPEKRAPAFRNAQDPQPEREETHANAPWDDDTRPASNPGKFPCTGRLLAWRRFGSPDEKPPSVATAASALRGLRRLFGEPRRC